MTWPKFVAVTLDNRGKLISSRIKTADFLTEDLGNGVMLDLVKIPAGRFTMGSPSREVGRLSSEGPQHLVSVPEFLMGRFEVTREQWLQVARLPKVKIELTEDPAKFKDSWQQPVESISWEAAVEFCGRLQKKTGKMYRLPTEAEWEYAARAGSTTPFAFGETITPQIVNHDGNYPYANAPKRAYRQKTVPVGSLGVANVFGLFDMHGNVWEWCEDDWHGQDDRHGDYKGAPADGRAWKPADIFARGPFRVLRGGSWNAPSVYCRSAIRSSQSLGIRGDMLGFRLARTYR